MELLFKFKKRIITCLVLEFPYRSLHKHLLLESLLYFENYLFYNLCVQIFLVGGRPMRVNFQILVFWPNIFFGIGPKLKQTKCLTLLMF